MHSPFILCKNRGRNVYIRCCSGAYMENSEKNEKDLYMYTGLEPLELSLAPDREESVCLEFQRFYSRPTYPKLG